ncbi:MAG TPA: hypothetical protein ENG51_09910 [Deltaproteobacteria bacterium]|nr:hypothetical protein [Deltaproteobacteria bacterium]HEC31460.1 hypothetical protein [Deltaproteobacteria bacterium]
MKRARLVGLIFTITVLSLLIASAGLAREVALTNRTESANEYQHFLNSPDVNIYWSSAKRSKTITIYGLVQNNYYTDLVLVNLYVDILDSNGKRLERRKQFFLEIEPDQKLPFRITFPRLKNAKKVRFSFDYNYAEWKSSVSNYGILEDTL